MKNNFKAPQKTLRTSWVQMAFSKPKTGGVTIKRSLSSRATPVIRENGKTTSLSQDFSY
jgi:hypothetical protein